MKNKNVMKSINNKINGHNTYYTEVESKASQRVAVEKNKDGSLKIKAGAAVAGKVQHWIYEAGKEAWEEALVSVFAKHAGKSPGNHKISVERSEKYFTFALTVQNQAGHSFKAIEIKAAPVDGDKMNPVMTVTYKPSDKMTAKTMESKISFKDAFSASDNKELMRIAEKSLEKMIVKSIANADKYLSRLGTKAKRVEIKMP